VQQNIAESKDVDAISEGTTFDNSEAKLGISQARPEVITYFRMN
jgi:hypothetical protein